MCSIVEAGPISPEPGSWGELVKEVLAGLAASVLFGAGAAVAGCGLVLAGAVRLLRRG